VTRVDRETGNCWECQGGLTCMHCHPEDNPKQTRRISELEAALRSIADMHTDADAAVPYSWGQTYFMRAHKIAVDALSNK